MTGDQEVDGVIFTMQTIADDFEAKEWTARAERMREAIRLIERLYAKQPRPTACAEDIGFGMQCRRERGHSGPHASNPRVLFGEEPILRPYFCDWSSNGDADTWDTGCRKAFLINDHETPEKAGMRFCCFCGGEVRQHI